MPKGLEKLKETGKDLKSFSYVWQAIQCRKESCKSCPHGPYLYARWREGVRVRAIYIGRTVPDELKSVIDRTART